MRPGPPPEELPELPPLGQLETRILSREQIDTRAGTIERDDDEYHERVHETERQPLVRLDEDVLGPGDATTNDGAPTTVEELVRPRHDTAPQTPVEESGSVPLGDEDLEQD
jgi:hypothetical protein